MVVEASIYRSPLFACGQLYDSVALWDERLGVVTAEVAEPLRMALTLSYLI